ncbi:MAG: hypothetical protein LBT45_00360 [Rickettsiales bacterium]|jgi:hypothetical protein|nr:hypothetical protein [Rickettsiales bacterium]
MDTASYKSEIYQYLHPEGTLGYMLEKMRYRRKNEFLRKIRDNIKWLNLDEMAAMTVLGKIRAQISGYKSMLESKRMSGAEICKGVDNLMSQTSWVYKKAGGRKTLTQPKSGPQKSRIVKTDSETQIFASEKEWIESIYMLLPADRQNENYSMVEFRGEKTELGYDPNGRGEYSQFIRPNAAANEINFVYGGRRPDTTLICATLRSRIAGAMKIGGGFFVKFDDMSPDYFSSAFIKAMAIVYSENPADYLQTVGGLVINGKERDISLVLRLVDLKKAEKSRNIALKRRISEMARAA